MAEEVLEVYSDGFDCVGNAYGMLINFNQSAPHKPSTYGEAPRVVSRVRMSWEMGKVLTFVLLRYIKKAELDTRVSYTVPIDLLNELKIPKEDWDGLWASQNLESLEG